MKRDMEKVRAVMLAMEARTRPYLLLMDPERLGGIEDASEMADYIILLASGGYLERFGNSRYRITWAGHEFLDNIRDEEVWRKTKAGAIKLGSWSVSILGDIAKGYIRAKAAELGLPIGNA